LLQAGAAVGLPVLQRQIHLSMKTLLLREVAEAPFGFAAAHCWLPEGSKPKVKQKMLWRAALNLTEARQRHSRHPLAAEAARPFQCPRATRRRCIWRARDPRQETTRPVAVHPLSMQAPDDRE